MEERHYDLSPYNWDYIASQVDSVYRLGKKPDNKKYSFDKNFRYFRTIFCRFCFWSITMVLLHNNQNKTDMKKLIPILFVVAVLAACQKRAQPFQAG